MISATGRGFRWDLSLALLSEIQCQLGVSTYSFNCALGACERAGRWEAAIELLARMGRQKAQADEISFSSLIDSCENSWPAAVNALQQMLDAELRPNVITHSSLIRVCATGSQWQMALNQLKVMRTEAVLPNRITINIVLRSFTSSANWQLALQLMQDAFSSDTRSIGTAPETSPRGLFQTRPSHSGKTEPDKNMVALLYKFIHSSILSFFRVRFHVLVSHATLHSSRPLAHDTSAAVLRVCEAATCWVTAVQLLAEAGQVDCYMLSAVMGACERGSKWAHALELLDRAVEDHFADHFMYTTAITACAKGKQWSMALTLFSRGRPDVISCSAALSACEKSQKWTWALHLFAEAVATKLRLDVMASSAAVSTCAAAGHWQWAFHLFSGMCLAGIRPDTFAFNAVCSSCDTPTEWPLTLIFLDEMKAQDDHMFKVAVRGSKVRMPPIQAICFEATKTVQ